MNHRSGLLLALICVLAAPLLAPRDASAQEPLPAVLPTVLFLVEESAAMDTTWAGDPTLTVPGTRYEYVRDAILQVVNNAPLGMDIGVAFTQDGFGALELLYGFEPVAVPGSGAANVTTALNNYSFNDLGADLVTWGESMAGILDNWADLPHSPFPSWLAGPFEYYCNSLIIITVGFSTGNYDGGVLPFNRVVPPLDVQCNGNEILLPQQGCYKDDVAYWANTVYSPAPLTNPGQVSVYSVLVDSNVATADATNLFNNAGTAGGGMFFDAPQPGAIASRFWQSLSDAFSGEYSNAAVSMSPNGDLMLASYFEVEGGYPLYKGHLLAWEIDNDPNNSTFGEIITNSSGISADPSTGATWDGGQLLASRTAGAGESNQLGYLQNQQRRGFTEDAAKQMYSSLLPFDATSLSPGSDLTTLLIDEVPVTSNQTCAPLDHDFDFDCDADVADAQILVDFLRGVPTSTFLSTGLSRASDEWKMGDTGHSTAVVAPQEIFSIALEGHFRAYRSKLAAFPGAVYVASNAGQIHAFDFEGTVSAWPTGGSELWFYAPRAKLDKDPAASKEFDGNQADDLMRSGQTYVNDGRLAIDHVWLDGYINDLAGCSGPGYAGGQDDGVIHPDGCEWHRVLTWSGGYGSRHTYALDVTNPLTPRFLWERTDEGATTFNGKGRAVGRPLVSAFWDGSGSNPSRRWIAVWGSGAQPPAAGLGAGDASHAAVYIHDMDSDPTRVPTVYQTQGFALTHPGPGVTDTDGDGFEEYPGETEGMFGSPAGADLDGDGSIDVAYIGDSWGYMFKVAFNQTSPNLPVTCLFAEPAAGDLSRHVYYEPAIFYSSAGELLVYWGTGSPYDIYDTGAGGIYAKADPEPFGCINASGTAPQSIASPCASGSALFDSTGFYALGSGGAVGEKIVGRPQVRSGRMFFATHIPGSDPCTLGVSRLYGMDVETCAGGLFDDTSDSYNVTSNLYTEVPGLISEPVFANGRLYALQVDGGGIDANSPISVAVTPNNFTDYVYVSYRHVF